MSSVLELENLGTSTLKSGLSRYMDGDKDLRIISSPKFTEIFPFKLISLAKCPKMAMCSARCYWTLLKGHYFVKKIRPYTLPSPQWLP